MNHFELINLIFSGIIALFFLYQIILIVISLCINKRENVNNNFIYSFLILIPAYKESTVLNKTTEALKKLVYHESKYKVIIIADDCDEQILSNVPFEVKKISLTQHNKVNSLKTVLPIENKYDYVVILDADNIVHPDFLKNLNKRISKNTLVIQGLRLPKNLQNRTARLDALTDFIYNELDRIIPAKLGLTGTLSGSGFAIERNLFQELINSINTFGGFDKILQSLLLLKNISIYVAVDAIVFDEKTSSRSEYIKQRRRWLYFHFYNSLKFGFRLLFNGIKNLNINPIHLGIISLRPPLNILLSLSLIFVILGFFINKFISMFLLSLIFLFTFYLLTVLKKAGVLTFDLFLSLPLILINQILSFVGITEARTDSLKTQKGENNLS